MRKSTIGMIIAGGFFCLALIGFGVITGAASSEIASQQEQLMSLKSRLDTVKSATASADTAAAEQARGYSAARVAHDEQMAEGYLSRIFNFSNFEEYKAARDVIAIELGVAEDDPMLTEFFPAVEPYEDGTNVVDEQGLNMTFKSAKFYLTGVGARYNWLAIVEADVTGDAGNTSTRTYGVTFQTEADNDTMLLPAGMILTRTSM